MSKLTNIFRRFRIYKISLESRGRVQVDNIELWQVLKEVYMKYWSPGMLMLMALVSR